MKTYTECIPCFVRQAYDAMQQVAADEELVHRTLQRVMCEACEFPLEQAPPAMAQTIHRIIRKETGNSDPYAEIKAESNRLALERAGEVRSVIACAIDPFKMSVRFSIGGNIMDFALASSWNRLGLDHFIEDTRLQSLENEPVDELRKAVHPTKSILFLGDNAGETVLDRLLIKQMSGADVYYAVKGSQVKCPVIGRDIGKAVGSGVVLEHEGARK